MKEKELIKAQQEYIDFLTRKLNDYIFSFQVRAWDGKSVVSAPKQLLDEDAAHRRKITSIKNSL